MLATLSEGINGKEVSDIYIYPLVQVHMYQKAFEIIVDLYHLALKTRARFGKRTVVTKQRVTRK